ncbi:hypothetical protein SEA_WOLLYPOG_49 [Arthrobacter phage Wollypog]|uniref:Uncharacterized protein n=1 Tax=Arthrobacter phage Wollypog TaxID=2790985 RepID=A0A7T3KC98_9CAUD|nr:hypothetical protein PP291_gp49 [Arthrobacter phage Wollypog]QPX62601.1 hypothetical protein SEA_WOLLYPOG_49 [Arthrobacter phage Wollypog]
MPSLKVSVNPDAKSAFQSYEGPTPPAKDGYEGVIKNVKVKVGKESQAPYLNVLLEHDSKDAALKQYNGCPQWIRVMFGEHDETQARLAAFIKAITGKANKEANIVDTDEEHRSGTGSIVKTIDGVKPDGKRVKFDLRARAAQNGYPESIEGDFIRAILNAPADAGSADAESEDEVDEDDIEVEGEEQTREERAAELKKEALADLKAAAAEAEIDIKGLKKAEIIEAILDWEFEDAADEDEESEEEDEEEVDTEEEEEGEEEDEDEEEDEEEDADPEAEIRAELADLDRTALKARLKEADPEAKVLKKDSDDDLRDKIVNAELGEPPF